ncbi:sensor histidine kinase [Myxococcus faecalis]|uniref:sensor histidine kinase n=1 Tax=Myxococcus faecalis TaxID=3115646 RepID=UPI0038D1F7E5
MSWSAASPAEASSTGARWGLSSRWFWPAVILAGYTVLALLYGAQLFVYRASHGEPPRLGEALLTGACVWYAWAALTPFVLAVARRVRATGRPWFVQLLLHLLPGVGFAVLALGLFAVLREWLVVEVSGGASAAWTYFLFIASKTTDFDLLIYFSLVGMEAAVAYARRMREEAVRASQLEAQLAQAQLQLLRSQLQPHFLFNTLHAISALMHRDVESADRMVGQLSELLRASLERDGRHEVPLSEELELLSPYLDIERTRFSDRLQVDVDVAEDARDALVPSLLLQPLVENAIRHGIAPRRGPGKVWVRVRRAGARLAVEVEDDGVGPPAGRTELEEGIGLGATRARLERLHGAEQSVTWKARAPSGFLLSLSLPYRRTRA